MTVPTLPFVPLEGSEPPTFGVDAFDSRPMVPSQAWNSWHECVAAKGAEECAPLKDHFTVSDIWFTNHILQAVIGAALVIGFWLWVSRNQSVVPGKRQFVGEFAYDLVRNGIARDIIGHDFRKWVPLLISLFSFILINNFFGVTFVFMFPTFSKIGFAWGLAILSWVVYNGAGIAKWGLFGYLKKMTVPAGVPALLLIFVIPLEALSNFIVRPITLGLRLFANLFAGHLVVMVFVLGGSYLLLDSHPIINKVAGGAALLLSFAVFALELLVSALQAYIFTVLTAQYISSATADEH